MEVVEHENLEISEKCHICNKNFSKEELELHFANVHLEAKDTKVKLFPCDQCDKTFKQKSNLKTHKRGVHLNDKPFACEFCGTAFIFENSLSTHHCCLSY